MRKLLSVLALLAMTDAAGAADLVTKAPTPRAPLFYGGSGFYYGLGTGGEATKIGSVGVATYEAGGLVNANAGYTMALSNDRWVAAQVNYARTNTDGRAECLPGSVCTLDNKQSIDFKLMYGAPLSVLSGIFSNASAAFPVLPPVPVGAINTSMHPYIAAGARVAEDRTLIDGIVAGKKTQVQGILGVGAMYQTNANTVVNTFVDWKFGSGHFLLAPGSEIKVGSTFRAGVTVNWGLGG